MKTKILFLILVSLTGLITVSCDQDYHQKKGAQPPATYKMTTPIPEGINIPDQVESRLGTLKFTDGFPDDATVEKLYDNLDFQRAVQAYLLGQPEVSMAAMRKALTSQGPANITFLTFEKMMDSHTFWLTANCNSPYACVWLDLHNGPLVLEVPPRVLGMINDARSRYVVDIGMVGPDRGEGGKYLIVPPGYESPVPEGYFVVKSTTFQNLYFFRLFAVNGDFQPAITSMKKYSRAYPLSLAGNPPENNFVDLSGKAFCGITPSDYRYWEYLNEVVQEEPLETADRICLSYYASVGIQKGRPFAPDTRLKKILTEAIVVGDATARAIRYKMREQDNCYYKNSAWRGLFIGGYKFEDQPGVLNMDGYVSFYYGIMGLSPIEEMEIIGKGAQYVTAMTDSKGNYLDGNKNYILHFPPDFPAKDFWSVIVYDYQTRSMLQTDQQFPMVSSQNRELAVNPDGSTDVYFGPEAPSGKENNWIQTIPGKGWFTMLRLYGPLKPWFDKTWRPGEIELMN